MEDIQPCPWCSSTDVHEEWHPAGNAGYPAYVSVCGKCGARGPHKATNSGPCGMSEARDRWDDLTHSLSRLVQHAATVLPQAWQIVIKVEHEAGWVELFDSSGKRINFPSHEETIEEAVADAIEFALTGDPADTDPAR
jgi:hypothetical protein